MTKITRLNKACAIIFANLLMTGVVEAKMQNEDLWQFISHLSTSVKTVNVNTINRFALPVTEVSQNDNFVFYTSDAVKLASGATLSAFDLRVNKKTNSKVLFAFDYAGQCVSLGEVRQHYAKMDITDTPRGHSVHEVTSHTAAIGDGQEVTFSFAETNPDCLSSVVITREK
ncbi:hypothetical protein [Phytobacter sp. RSE-02]|uniref:hypothetical protein n=1 Tax=Phytobacter sp. RSE-02 TaxID=3229229 RepID=UPI00339D57D4